MGSKRKGKLTLVLAIVVWERVEVRKKSTNQMVTHPKPHDSIISRDSGHQPQQPAFETRPMGNLSACTTILEGSEPKGGSYTRIVHNRTILTYPPRLNRFPRCHQSSVHSLPAPGSMIQMPNTDQFPSVPLVSPPNPASRPFPCALCPLHPSEVTVR